MSAIELYWTTMDMDDPKLVHDYKLGGQYVCIWHILGSYLICG